MFDKKWFDALEIKLPDDYMGNDRIFRMKPNIADIDFNLLRPLQKIGNWDHLRKFVEIALDREFPALELATLGLEEAKIRAASKNRPKFARAVKGLFKKRETRPILWLSDARKKAWLYHQKTRNQTGAGVVYFVLIKGFTHSNQYYGCYVGQSKTNKIKPFADRQSARISQHFQNVKASTRVKERGLEPLWSLNCYSQNLPFRKQELLNLETGYHNAIAEVVPRVLGDTQP